jgi:hypothetical protein
MDRQLICIYSSMPIYYQVGQMYTLTSEGVLQNDKQSLHLLENVQRLDIARFVKPTPLMEALN